MLNSVVVLHNQGEIALEEFLKNKKIRKDILIEVKIPKEKLNTSFQTVRRNSTDFPILNMAVTKNLQNRFRIVLGATPKKATLSNNASNLLSLENPEIEKVVEAIKDEIVFESNMRGSAEYRKALIHGMLIKAYEEVKRKECY